MRWITIIAAILGFICVFLLRDPIATITWAGVGIFLTLLRGVEQWLG